MFEYGAMAPAEPKIRSKDEGEGKMNGKGKMIDLSQEIYTGMPVYPGHAKTVIWEHMSHE